MKYGRKCFLGVMLMLTIMFGVTGCAASENKDSYRVEDNAEENNEIIVNKEGEDIPHIVEQEKNAMDFIDEYMRKNDYRSALKQAITEFCKTGDKSLWKDGKLSVECMKDERIFIDNFAVGLDEIVDISLIDQDIDATSMTDTLYCDITIQDDMRKWTKEYCIVAKYDTDGEWEVESVSEVRGAANTTLYQPIRAIRDIYEIHDFDVMAQCVRDNKYTVREIITDDTMCNAEIYYSYIIPGKYFDVEKIYVAYCSFDNTSGLWVCYQDELYEKNYLNLDYEGPYEKNVILNSIVGRYVVWVSELNNETGECMLNLFGNIFNEYKKDEQTYISMTSGSNAIPLTRETMSDALYEEIDEGYDSYGTAFYEEEDFLLYIVKAKGQNQYYPEEYNAYIYICQNDIWIGVLELSKSKSWRTWDID